MTNYHEEKIRELIWDIRHENVEEDLEGLKYRLIRLGELLSEESDGVEEDE